MRKDSNTNLLLIGHLEGLKHAAIAYAIQRAQAMASVIDICASIDTAARGTTEGIVVFSNILRDSEVFNDNELIIKNAKSQTSNWNRRNRYKPIYRRSIIS